MISPKVQQKMVYVPNLAECPILSWRPSPARTTYLSFSPSSNLLFFRKIQLKGSGGAFDGNSPDIFVPNFSFPYLSFPPTVLEEKQQLLFENLKITEEQSKKFELQTREQSFSKDWHRLRKFSLTASNFKSTCSRQKDFKTL